MIKDWIDRITLPRDELGNFSVCPSSYTEEEVISIASEYNKIYPEMVFLPDPKDRYTEINGVQTNNGKYNIILCQRRDNLKKARSKLLNTSYYSFWNQAYLNEIISQ